jgi:hypothetical protein
LAAEFEVDENDVVLHKITKGSIEAWVSINPNDFLIIKSKILNSEDVSVIPFFEALLLSP